MELLNKIQKNLKVGKGRWNKFGEFYYRSAADILKAYKEVQGDSIITSIARRVGPDIVTFVTYHHGDFSLTVEAPAREEESRPKMSSPQLTGTAMSYSLKYALGLLFGLCDEPDPDSEDNSKQGKKTAPKATPEDPAQGRTMITDRVKAVGYEIGFGQPDDEAFTKWAGKAISDMSAQDCRDIWKTLDKFAEFMKGTV